MQRLARDAVCVQEMTSSVYLNWDFWATQSLLNIMLISPFRFLVHCLQSRAPCLSHLSDHWPAGVF